MTDAPAGTRVAIALGSNLGDRRALLNEAARHLERLSDDLQLSHFHETAPVGVPGPQPDYLNAAAVGHTRRTPRELLTELLAIERGLGRTRPHAGAPRTVDLDLILYGDRIIDDEPDLLVPHPRFRERAFVLAPLAEIAADMRDPVTGLTVGELLARLAAAG